MSSADCTWLLTINVLFEKYDHYTVPDDILFSYPASISVYLMEIEELIAINHGDILIMDLKKINYLLKGRQFLAYTQRKDKQALRKKKKRTFFFKDKENINYSNNFNNAKPGWCIFPVITEI